MGAEVGSYEGRGVGLAEGCRREGVGVGWGVSIVRDISGEYL